MHMQSLFVVFIIMTKFYVKIKSFKLIIVLIFVSYIPFNTICIIVLIVILIRKCSTYINFIFHSNNRFLKKKLILIKKLFLISHICSLSWRSNDLL